MEGGDGNAQVPRPTFMPSAIPLPAKLEFKGNVASNWKRFKRSWENYEIAQRLKAEDKGLRTATLLSAIGTDALDVFDGFHFDREQDKNDIDIVLQKYETFCVGATNEIYERYLFNKRNQENGETIDAYVAALRSLARSCNYETLRDSLIRDRIVVGIFNDGTRKKLLQTSDLTLEKCITICRACETTDHQMKSMKNEQVSYVGSAHGKCGKKKTYQNSEAKDRTQAESKPLSRIDDCRFCGRSHVRSRDKCPAYGSSCTFCGGRNHFEVKCKKRKSQNRSKRGYGKQKVSLIDDSTTDSDYEDYVLSIDDSVMSVTDTLPKKLYAQMVINRKTVKFQLDSGATVNVMPLSIVQNLFNDTDVQMERYDGSLNLYNNTEMKTLGKKTVQLRNPKTNNIHDLEFVIVKDEVKPVLGSQAVQEMNLITVNVQNIMALSGQTDLLKQYSDIFNGEGRLEGKLHLDVDPTVSPVKMPLRKVPLAMKPKLKDELHRLEKLGIIQKVSVPTDWISSMVIVMKSSGHLRICLDPKPLNKALKRNHYVMPTIDDVLPELSNAKLFTVVDAKNGFWHVSLDEDSSYLTTFATPWGRYRWNRMPFGISPAPEEFQRRLNDALENLDGTTAIHDDIIVYGKGDNIEEASRDHDEKLDALFQRCREKGIKINRSKIKLKKAEVSYLGHLISAEGLKADPTKVEAILDMPVPTDKQGIQRLLGLTNFVQKFAPQLSDATAPFRELLRKDVAFQWDTDVHTEALKDVKSILSAPPVLKFFNVESETLVQSDASERGLGACLMQEGHPIMYASRALTDTEVNYAQIEKELLSIVFAMEKFDRYVYGRHVVVENDHKPLETILKKSLLSAPKRLQRMMLRLQRYEFELRYKKGTLMVMADTLSRAYLPNDKKPVSTADRDVLMINGQSQAEREVESVDMLQFVPISSETFNTISQASARDPETQKLIQVIKEGWPDNRKDVSSSVQDYYNYRDELSYQNSVVYKGERVVVPKSVRQEIVGKLHASHIGIQGCLRRAREAVFWPNMSSEITENIRKCDICAFYSEEQQKEPLESHTPPTLPWEKVGSDLFELDGQDYLVTVDYYSDFIEVDRLYDKTASTVIKKLKQHFARHGIPTEVMTDNGPPFGSKAFEAFKKHYDFKHTTSSPHYPQSNGKVENSVKTIKRLLRKSQKAGTDPYLVLLDWRNTPSEGMGSSPAQRLFSRRTRTLLNMCSKQLVPKAARCVQKFRKCRQSKQKAYYDRNTRPLSELKPGEIVVMKPQGREKGWKSAEVKGKVGKRSYQVETEGGMTYRRNRNHLRGPKQVTFQRDVPDMVNPQVNTPPQRRKSVSVHLEDRLPPPCFIQPRAPPEQAGLGSTKTRSGRTVRPPSYLKDYLTG